MEKDKEEKLVCKSCGRVGETVKERECCYSREINVESVIEVICDDCEYEHAMAI